MAELWKGALKAAIGRLCTVVLAMPAIDPQHFSLVQLGGLEHVTLVFVALTVVAEAQYWKQWAEK